MAFSMRHEASEAKYRAKAATENTRDLRDQVVRDVRTAWLAANTAFQRVSVAAELVKQADLSLNLAQGRYQPWLGLDRRTQSGAVAANRRCHRLRERAVSVPTRAFDSEL